MGFSSIRCTAQVSRSTWDSQIPCMPQSGMTLTSERLPFVNRLSVRKRCCNRRSRDLQTRVQQSLFCLHQACHQCLHVSRCGFVTGCSATSFEDLPLVHSPQLSQTVCPTTVLVHTCAASLCMQMCFDATRDKSGSSEKSLAKTRAWKEMR